MTALVKCELNNDIKLWFGHVLVGDGVNTSEAAARRLLARALVEPLGQLRYFLAVYKCSSHQANLVAKGAVIGAGALPLPLARTRVWCVQSLTWQFVERQHASIST